jgi:hypothetical protein
VVLALRLTLHGVIKRSTPVHQGKKERVIVIANSYYMPLLYNAICYFLACFKAVKAV